MNKDNKFQLAALSLTAILCLVACQTTETSTDQGVETNVEESVVGQGVETNVEESVVDGENGGPVDPSAIPLGDGMVSNSPEVGNTFACNTNFREGGAVHAGDWVDLENNTWNYLEKVKVSGSVSWPEASFTMSADGGNRILTTNGLPNSYSTGEFPIRRNDPAYEFDTNPNPISEQDFSYSVPLNPTEAATPTCTPLGPIGVMLDGVVLFNALDDAGLDAVANETQDECDGHPSGREVYHYHNVSNCTLEDVEGASTLVGYALDGFGIYVERDADGNLLTNADLDECHGRTSEVRWNGAIQEMYHYSATTEYPYTVGCFKGEPVI